MFVAPIAGALSDRSGGQRLMAVGLALQSAGLLWIAAVSTPTTPYVDLVGPFILAGIGMALFFAPVANVVLSSVSPAHEGKASGATNAIRELGGVFGVAVLAAVFTRVGGYRTSETFVHGLTTAVTIGGGLLAFGAVAARAESLGYKDSRTVGAVYALGLVGAAAALGSVRRGTLCGGLVAVGAAAAALIRPLPSAAAAGAAHALELEAAA